MTILVNGQETAVGDDASLVSVLLSLGIDEARRGVAVALNESVVPRSSWAEQRLAESDRVEVIQASVGG